MSFRMKIGRWAVSFCCAVHLPALAYSPPVEIVSTNVSEAPRPTFDEPDLCAAAAVAMAESMVFVALGAGEGQVTARRHTKGLGWSDWTVAPTVATGLRGGPSVVNLPRDGGVLVTVCDASGGLRATLLRSDNTWGAWQPLGAIKGGCAFAPTPLADERAMGLQMFAVSAIDGQVWHGTASASSASAASAAGGAQLVWEPLGAKASAAPLATRDSAGVVHLAVRGPGGEVFHRSSVTAAAGGNSVVESGGGGGGGAWSAWKVLPGRVRGAPRLLQTWQPPALLDLYARGWADSAAYRLYQAAVRPPHGLEDSTAANAATPPPPLSVPPTPHIRR